eukprot:TRINITY_DN218_c1_g2_i1.p1 TRINITY_DN218_c1_g2~~TRINITY_DN218_c1_g2_i1.p1  ORF type:complete len:1052 (-),score=219.37 TRINITY_DN218_c1_g2_i1:16-3150(-)
MNPAARSPAPDVKVVCRILGGDAAGGNAAAQAGAQVTESLEVIDSRTIRLPVITVKGKATPDSITKKDFIVHEVLPTDASTERLYSSVLGPSLAHGVFSGKNATLLSFGAEKSGKSYSLFGPLHRVQVWDGRNTEVGVVSRMLHDVFEHFAVRKRANPTAICCLQLSIFTILKTDVVQDLLAPGSEGTTAVRLALDADRGLDATTVGNLGTLRRDFPVPTGAGTVIPGLSYVLVGDKPTACRVINDGLQSANEMKTDKIVVANILQSPPASQQASGRLICTSVLVIDCSPVYSKSMHNVRDIANSSANRHKSTDFNKSNLTRLLRPAFTGASLLRVVTHCRVSSFDLDLFDSLSTLNFAALVMKVQDEGPAPEARVRQAAPVVLTRTTVPASEVRDARDVREVREFREATAAAATPSGGPEVLSSASGSNTSSLTSPMRSAEIRRIYTPSSNAAPPAVAAATQAPTPAPIQLPPPNYTSNPAAAPPPPAALTAAVQRIDATTPEPRSASVTSNALVLGSSSVVRAESMMQNSVMYLTQQLKEKEEKLHRAFDSIEQMSGLLQKAQYKNRSLDDKLEVANRLIKQLEAQQQQMLQEHTGGDGTPRTGHFTDDHAAFVDSTDEEERTVLAHVFPPGSTAAALLGAVDGQNSPSPPRNDKRASERRVEPPTRWRNNNDDGSDSDGSSASSAVEVELEYVEQDTSGSDSSDADVTARGPRKDRGGGQLQKLKKQNKALLAQLHHQSSLATQYANRLEEAEKRCQEHILKTVSLSTRLEETKKWVRKQKRMVQTEKERVLPILNDQLQSQIEVRRAEERRQEEFRRQCETFIEQQNVANHELQLKCEKIASLEAMIQALGKEYNRKLGAMMAQSQEWQQLVSSLDPRAQLEGGVWPRQYVEVASRDGDTRPPENLGPIHLQLRLENETLKSNMQSMMQVVEHCYEENARLSDLTAKLTKSLTDANEHFVGGGGGGGSGVNQAAAQQFRIKEEKYLSQISSLHFQLLRCKKLAAEAGVEIDDEEELDDLDEPPGYGSRPPPHHAQSTRQR